MANSLIKYYDAEKVSQVLSWPIINEAVKEAFKAVSRTEESTADQSFVNQPPRTVTECGGKRTQLLFTMPAYVGNYQMSTAGATNSKRNTLACKLVTSFSENSARSSPLPNIMANILLFDSETGKLESIVDGTQITAWRTAGASIVATQYLYFARCSNTPNVDIARPINVAIIGCGVQGNSHARGMCATYNVSNIYLWNRTASKADELAEKLRAEYPGVNVHVSIDPAEAIADADVICIATFAQTALITLDMIRKDDVHINSVGAGQINFGEVSQDIYENAQLFVDSWTNARAELRDLKATIIGEVGEVIKNKKQPNKKGITIFQSMGMASEDATVAHAVVEAIKKAET